MPEKRLIAHYLLKDGEVCALGAVGHKRGVDLEKLDPEDHATLSDVFNIAYQLVQEVEFLNDDDYYYSDPTTPEKRWERMRKWAASKINPVPDDDQLATAPGGGERHGRA